ncbi:midasin-like [Corticium candelabrum]|uniref:midasin-like n=1 Tax=Corticium candelabrum TaxID=121492 RepID=UPI002E2662B2|nr:midasin-like [Corticium candelabrum]
MECSDIWRLHNAVSHFESKKRIFSVLSKHKLSQSSIVLISSRAAEDISSAIGSVLLSSSSDDVVQVVKQACQWLTLAVASATTDVSSLPAELQENLLVNLTGVVTAAPHLTEFVARAFKDVPFPLRRMCVTQQQDSVRTSSVIRALYRLLLLSKDILSHIWDWGDVVYLLGNSESDIRWYAIEIISLLVNLQEDKKIKLRSYFISNEAEADHLSVDFEELLESNRFWRQGGHHKLNQDNELLVVVDSSPSLPVVSIAGIHLTIQRSLLESRTLLCGDGSLVLTPSTCRNLRSLALAISLQKCAVLLEGPVGTGKTVLAECMAAVLGRSHYPLILKVQLGGHTDSRSLIGMYQCSDRPGEFFWQPGVLTEAVTKGYWILLEDIDSAPVELMSLLIPLMETGRLNIPSYGATLKATPGFQLIATQRTLSAGSSRVNLGTQMRQTNACWSHVVLEPMSNDELVQVIGTRFPSLRTSATKLVEIFCFLSTEMHSQPMPSLSRRRDLSLRDLIKLCERLTSKNDGEVMTVTVSLLQDVMDCFLVSAPTLQELQQAACAVGSLLGFNADKVRFVCLNMKPSLELSQSHVTIGRATLSVLPDKLPLKEFGRPHGHALTRHVMVLLEQLAVCVQQGEPVLLVGETGTGKTSTVQHLSRLTGHHLTVLNLSQQSDSSDLLGGFKPVDLRKVVGDVRDQFLELFGRTFSVKKNVQFLRHIQDLYTKFDWETLLKLMCHCLSAGKKKSGTVASEWETLGLELQQLMAKLREANTSFVFAFVEGKVVEAVKNGNWILLDEINLASSETLDCLSGLLEKGRESAVLLEKGELQPVPKHSEFRLFACMNPATDIGKHDLPIGIRSRFTEIYVSDMNDPSDLKQLVLEYLQAFTLTAKQLNSIVSLYGALRDLAQQKLVDIGGHKPHYSLRTLCRALTFAVLVNCGSVLRSLYEGFCFSFTSQLDRASHVLVLRIVAGHLMCSVQLLQQPIPRPMPHSDYVNIEGYWLKKGDQEAESPADFVLTETVKANLRDVARVVCVRRYPLLLQGPTSVGKTSLIRFLAQLTGHRCIRINNHEHTDLQEYVGCYVADQHGKLVFQEGPLVDAMRNGYWVILDELNLAPTDVLEALNRVLDENRELFITETQEVVRAEAGFMLFATQNPPGQYGGRKLLSRAFRNRFVELHFDEIPTKELETILEKRCSIPLSYCSKLVSVMKDLQTHRRGSGVFAGKYGFITLRDLFRWAERYRRAVVSEKFYDWEQHLAEDGYLLLGGRVRKATEEDIIRETIEKHFKRKISVDHLFGVSSNLCDIDKLSPLSAEILRFVRDRSSTTFHHLVLTRNIRRILVLAGRSFLFQEPVLLVGETGCGKTTVCQLFAELKGQQLFSVNCHMHTEAADFLGSLRPVRSHSVQDGDGLRLFEWQHGPLVLAMMSGACFLVDEISLADDSVLERLNSVLEPERRLLLAERVIDGSNNESQDITAHEDFLLFATMNPGGDFGKKELSAALSNRFTEVWCYTSNDRADLLEIIRHNLKLQPLESCNIGERMLDFMYYWNSCVSAKRSVSVRDLLSWVEFINVCNTNSNRSLCPIDSELAFVHGACLIFVDGIDMFTGLQDMSEFVNMKQKILEFLFSQVKESTVQQLLYLGCTGGIVENGEKSEGIISDKVKFGIYPFFIPQGNSETLPERTYTFGAPVSCQNVFRLLRGLQLPKPVLLEGSPGVGKTSLVMALAAASGHAVVRINLSEQTDINDLFGTDLPLEGGKPGEFAWRDGPLLSALKEGDWVVLDELNLASQSVLEGLNACFDHRSEIYVPELNTTFAVQQEKTRIFACQNPAYQGGNRKGLPKSFINRFTSVFMQEMGQEDYLFIIQNAFSDIEHSVLSSLVAFNAMLHEEAVINRRWGLKGGPWELNLRDLFRWCQLMMKYQSPGCWNPLAFVDTVYTSRFRSAEDKQKVGILAADAFGDVCCSKSNFGITPSSVKIGMTELQRIGQFVNSEDHFYLLHHWLQPLNALVQCLDMGWMAILVGCSGVGKSSLVRALAQLTGHKLLELPVSYDMDTTELLGGFEQGDLKRDLLQTSCRLKSLAEGIVQDMLVKLALPDSGDQADCLSVISNLLSTKNCLEAATNFLSTGDLLKILQRAVTKVEYILPFLEALYFDCHDKLKELQVVVRLLRDQITVGDCHGGVFQWVDSVLVQAIQNGDWVLLDNANFCSSSVLDRLNPLLEPNGKLRVDERGVIDGQIVTVTPHKNFRLILTMDCANGELSRAFRNRGIEIYMLGEEDNGGQMDNEDIWQLFLDAGLQSRSLQDWISRLLNTLRPFSQGPFFSAARFILDAVKLLGLLLSRGVELISAVKTAFEESLPVHLLHPDIKDAVQHVLDDAYAELPSVDLNTLPGTTIQPSTHHCILDSRMAMIRRESQLLLKYLLSSDGILPIIQRLLPDIQGNQLQKDSLVFQAIVLYSEMASPSDLARRFLWVQRKLDTFKTVIGVEGVMTIINSVKEALTAVFSHPLYVKLCDQLGAQDTSLAYLGVNKMKWPLLESRRIWALWRYMVEKQRLSQLSLSVKHPREGSVLAFGVAAVSGLIASETLAHPCMTHLVQVLLEYEAIVLALLNQLCISSYDEALQVEMSFQWYWRLQRVCCLELGCQPNISRIRLHWQLFKTLSLDLLNVLVAKFGVVVPVELSTALSDLDDALETTSNSAFEQWHKYFGYPRPFRSRVVAQAYMEVETFVSAFQGRKVSKQRLLEILRLLVALCDLNASTSEVDKQSGIYLVEKALSMCGDSVVNQEERKVEKNGSLQSLYDINCLYFEARVVSRTCQFVLIEEDKFDEKLTTSLTQQISSILECNFSTATTLINNIAQYMRLENTVTRGDISQVRSCLPDLLLSVNERLMACGINNYWDQLSEQPDIVKDAADAMRLKQDVNVLDSAARSVCIFYYMRTFGNTYQSYSTAASTNMCQNVNITNYKTTVDDLVELQKYLWMSFNTDCSQVSYRASLWIRLAALSMDVVLGLHVTPQCCKEVLSQLNAAAVNACECDDACKKQVAIIVFKGLEVCKDCALQLTVNGEKLLLTCLKCLLCILTLEQDNRAELTTLGQGLASCGLLRLLLLTPDNTIDPVEKEKCQLDWANAELVDKRCELVVQQAQDVLLNGRTQFPSVCNCDWSTSSSFPGMEHSCCPHQEHYLLTWCHRLVSIVSDLENKAAYRPETSQFVELVGDIQRFTTAIASCDQVQSLINRLCESVSCGSRKSEVVVKEARVFLQSSHLLLTHLKQSYPFYRDMIMPFAASLFQVMEGIQTLLTAIHISSSKTAIADLVVSSLCQLPGCDSLLHSAEALVNASYSELCSDEIVCQQLVERGQLAAIALIQTSCEMCGLLETPANDLLQLSLSKVSHLWKIAKEEKSKRHEASPLFKYKTEKHLSDETQNLEIDENEFSRFSDFEDIVNEPSLSDSHHVSQSLTYSLQVVSPLVDLDVRLVSIHHWVYTKLVRTSWIWQRDFDLNASSLNKGKVRSLFAFGYQMVWLFADCLKSSNLDSKLSCSHLLAVNDQLRSFTEPTHVTVSSNHCLVGFQDLDAPYDIYKDSNVNETTSLAPVLGHLSSHITMLLEMWPENPMLTQLLVIVDRIKSFCVTSPLTKFLAGLELLLQKSQDWELCAASQYSLKKELSEVSEVVLRWRKMELKSWPSVLETVYWKHACKTSRWWFYLYDIIQPYLESSCNCNTEVNSVFNQFMESSTLGEFSSRLQMIFAFHCYLASTVASPECHPVVCTLWHTYNYYRQFLTSVTDYIVKMRVPIEKELKDMTEITKWSDVNYWALKHSTEKSHKTLHKLARKYEELLNGPVNVVLNVKSLVQFMVSLDSVSGGCTAAHVIDEEMMASVLDHLRLDFNLENKQFMESMMEVSIDTGTPGLHDVNVCLLGRKLKKQITRLMTVSAVHTHLDNLNSIFGMTSQLQEMLKMDHGGSVDRIHIKRQTQQKRLLLSSLLKALKTAGLSYRKGNRMRQSGGAYSQCFLLPALDIGAAAKQFEILAFGKWSHKHLQATVSAWETSQQQFYLSLAQMAAFDAALLSPSKDVNFVELEKISGYGICLADVLCHQHEALSKFVLLFLRLCFLLDPLKHMVSDSECETTFPLPSQNKTHHWMMLLKDLVNSTLLRLHQFLLVLDCYPFKDVFNEKYRQDLPLYSQRCGYEIVVEGRKEIEAVVGMVSELKRQVDKLVLPFLIGSSNGCNRLLTRADALQVSAGYEKCARISDRLSVVLRSLQGEAPWSGDGGILAILKDIEDHITTTVDQYMQWWDTEILQDVSNCDGSSDISGTFSEFTDAINCLVTNLLEVVQHLVLVECPIEETEGRCWEVQQGLLTGLLHGKTKSRLQCLNIEKIFKAMERVTSLLLTAANATFSSIPQTVQMMWNMVLRLVRVSSLVESYTVLASWYLSESVAVHKAISHLLLDILRVFTTTVAEGFGTPEEIVEEAVGDGKADFQDVDPAGMGEGEGIKDVSNQIESEDQLLDTNSSGDKQQQQDDSNLRNEENAIEMSEDIDASFADDDPRTQVDSDEDSDQAEDEDDDIKESMGEIGGPGEEKLDNRMWGSDSEDEEDPPATDTENGKNGSQAHESHLVAKGENQVGNDRNNDKHQEIEEETTNINEVEVQEEEDMRDVADNIPEALPPSDATLDLPDDMAIDSEDIPEPSPDLEMQETLSDVPEEDKENGDSECDNGKAEKLNDVDEAEEAQCLTETSVAGQENTTEETNMEAVNSENDLNNAQSDTTQAHLEQSAAGNESAAEVLETKDLASEEQKQQMTVGLERSQVTESGDQEGQSTDAAGDSIKEMSRHSKQKQDVNKEPPKRSRLMKSHENRQQDLLSEPNAKKQRVLDKDDDDVGSHTEKTDRDEPMEADSYQHMPLDDSEEHDDVTVAAATEDQARQVAERCDDEFANQDLMMESTDEMLQCTSTSNEDDQQQQGARSSESVDRDVPLNELTETEADDNVLNSSVDRPHTDVMSSQRTESSLQRGLMLFERQKIDINALRRELESQLNVDKEPEQFRKPDALSAEMWMKYSVLTAQLSRELCEQLRLVLEPTQTARLRGDYRTGKRLNMKKVIPYIASQFRKDKIWLRRTKPSKRRYQIMLAIDDSSSMADNQSKQMAFEALAVISNGLRWLESGEFGVCSFGESARIVHSLNEPFTDQSGINTICQFSFQQKKTRVAEMVQKCTASMLSARQHAAGMNSQLLLVISDGRGIFLEGTEVVRSAIREAHNAGVLIVFIIVDNPTNKDSIMDILVPVFHSGRKLPIIKSYMDDFPFPFYILLRDVISLPETLSDALRQWFEFIAAVDY